MKVLLRNKAATGACNEIKGFIKSAYINFLPPGAWKVLNGRFLKLGSRQLINYFLVLGR
jgi:hypothetical protein